MSENAHAPELAGSAGLVALLRFRLGTTVFGSTAWNLALFEKEGGLHVRKCPRALVHTDVLLPSSTLGQPVMMFCEICCCCGQTPGNITYAGQAQQPESARWQALDGRWFCT